MREKGREREEREREGGEKKTEKGRERHTHDRQTKIDYASHYNN